MLNIERCQSVDQSLQFQEFDVLRLPPLQRPDSFQQEGAWMEIQFMLALISIQHLLISFDLICLIVLQYQLLQDNTLQKKV